MKWWLGLLVLANLAIHAYFNWLPAPPAITPAGHAPIRPELLRILPPPAENPAAAMAPGCYAWGNFSGEAAARAQAALQRLDARFVARPVTPQEALRYWVYLPPRRSLAEARAKADELRLRGVQDFHIVMDPQWRYAISLGLFRDERLADALLEQLEAQGVASAVKSMRNQEGEQYSFHLDAPAREVLREIIGLQPDFPGSEIRPVPCGQEE